MQVPMATELYMIGSHVHTCTCAHRRTRTRLRHSRFKDGSFVNHFQVHSDVKGTNKSHCYLVRLPSPLFLSFHTVMEPQQTEGCSNGSARALQPLSRFPVHKHHVLGRMLGQLSLKKRLWDPPLVRITAIHPLTHLCICANSGALLSLGQAINGINGYNWGTLKLQICISNRHIDVLGFVEEFGENRSLQQFLLHFDRLWLTVSVAQVVQAAPGSRVCCSQQQKQQHRSTIGDHRVVSEEEH